MLFIRAPYLALFLICSITISFVNSAYYLDGILVPEPVKPTNTSPSPSKVSSPSATNNKNVIPPTFSKHNKKDGEKKKCPRPQLANYFRGKACKSKSVCGKCLSKKHLHKELKRLQKLWHLEDHDKKKDHHKKAGKLAHPDSNKKDEHHKEHKKPKAEVWSPDKEHHSKKEHKDGKKSHKKHKHHYPYCFTHRNVTYGYFVKQEAIKYYHRIRKDHKKKKHKKGGKDSKDDKHHDSVKSKPITAAPSQAQNSNVKTAPSTSVTKKLA